MKISNIFIALFFYLSLAACSGTAIKITPSPTIEPSRTNTPIPLPTVTAPFTPAATAASTNHSTALPNLSINPILPPAQAVLGDTWTSPVDGMELVFIPAGDFLMGCDPAHNDSYECEPDELPLHTVTLDAYWIDKTEVSNAQYEQCVTAGACDRPNNTSSYSRSAYYGNISYANYPVIHVSWQDAADYCEWAGRELPTEAQWEKAARGENPRAYPWGDEKPSCELVNGEVDGEMCKGDTTEVGKYLSGASPYGVLDMAGNVWEWVRDWHAADYYSSQGEYIHPLGPDTGTYKVFRGGGFGFHDLRTVSRRGGKLDSWVNHLGFRCAVRPVP